LFSLLLEYLDKGDFVERVGELNESLVPPVQKMLSCLNSSADSHALEKGDSHETEPDRFITTAS
jgi:hypothetical protein